MSELSYATPSGITVTRTTSAMPYKKGLKHLLHKLDRYRGIYLSSGYEYPERYSRWDVASLCPPLEIIGAGRDVEFRPLNGRGQALIRMLRPVLENHPHWQEFAARDDGSLHGRLKPLPALFPEEERSKQPSAFSILRTLIQEFANPGDARLALVGAFGYDLLFQFDPIELKLPRDGHKDLHLFLCDDIYYMDRKKEQIERFRYDFARDGVSTAGLPRTGAAIRKAPKRPPDEIRADHSPEEYMANVEAVRGGMRQGDYYEVVLRQTFQANFSDSPSELFERIQHASPSPYEFFLQLGEEQLIGASPEMFVRVEGQRVETCPIAGTARRTGEPLQDAQAIRELLNSTKEESELTMCTDVDRNDKSRVSVPGSVKVIGRRLIESYAGVFHTVDHVEGILQPGFDSLDAFLTHMWAVTIIGAPKKAAAQAMEEQETRMKATGFFRALRPAQVAAASPATNEMRGQGVKLLLIDNDDCFIHTLSNYARQTGAEVVTYRAGLPTEMIAQIDPDLILISPGPKRPEDFGVPDVVKFAAKAGIPLFGVCLGLQGIVEAFGGELGVLDYPMHGKPSTVVHRNLGIFEGLPERFKVGRYHSLFARRETFPACLEVTAESEDGVIMGIRHRELPIEAVQFHPESILTLDGNCGLRLIENVVSRAALARTASPA